MNFSINSIRSKEDWIYDLKNVHLKSRFEVLCFLFIAVIHIDSSSTSDIFHLRHTANTMSASLSISGNKSLSPVNSINELHNCKPHPPLTH